MEKTVSVAEAKNQLSELLNRVIYRHERVNITKRGKLVGALVSTEDLKRLEESENLKLLKRVKAIEKSTKKYIPFEQFVRDYEKKWRVDLGLNIAEDKDVHH